MTLATILLFGFMALLVCAWIVAELEYQNAEREKQFEKMFMRAQSILDPKIKPTEKLMNELLILVNEREKWQNYEKVNKIKTDFFVTYKKLSDEILSENEFEPANVFKN